VHEVVKRKRQSRRPRTFEVRPVSARPLKSALDTLRPHLSGCRALDLFSGLGRFGLGALEEGAESVTFVDTDGRYLEDIERSAASYPGARLVKQDAFRFLAQSTEQFDLIFADPPFPLWNEAFDGALFRAVRPRLTEGGIFLVKHPKAVIVSGLGLTHWKTSPFGESSLSYFTHGDKQ
jgi:16S rRNA (guanine966-N2)-methyltransferase